MTVFPDDLASQVGEAVKISLTKCNAESLGDQTVSISIKVKISKDSDQKLQVQTFLNEARSLNCMVLDENGNWVPC